MYVLQFFFFLPIFGYVFLFNENYNNLYLFYFYLYCYYAINVTMHYNHYFCKEKYAFELQNLTNILSIPIYKWDFFLNLYFSLFQFYPYSYILFYYFKNI